MGKHLELTPRLRQIAAWVRQGAHLADVGTDHAYLPVWLTLQGRVASAIASDLRRGPLDRAQETGRRYGVGDRITFRLGNGLAAVAPEECDTIVIAGMGGENIAQILAGAPWTADGRHTLLLQPQSRAEALRRFLAEHGFAVVGHDHLGHGRTARNPLEFGWFADRDGWKHVVKDVRALRERVGAEYPGLPCFLLGHSMGSFVVRGYLMFWPGTVDGAILSGTGQEPPATVAAGRALSALLIRLKGPRAHSPLLDALSVGRYNGQFKPVRTSADWISRDTVVVDAYRADPLCRFLPTVGMYHDMMVGLQLLAKPANLARMDPDTPVYFFAGDRDPVGANGAGVKKVAGWFRDAGVKDLTVRLYPEGRHEMLNEANRDEVYRDVLSWLERRLPA